MTTVLNVNLNDLNSQFINNLKQKFGKTTEVEIRLQDKSPADDLFSEDDFWRIIEQIDWAKKGSENKIATSVKMLAKMPVSSMYLFADKLSMKLYHLDTRAHAMAYAVNEPDNFVSADDFLYARCAVIAEGKEYYEKVLNDPSQMPDDIVFEPLLYLADDAFALKMGIPFNYMPIYNYETQSNKAGWRSRLERMAHKNSDDSEKLHHLYEIVDKVDYDTFKYGISCDPISKKDGMPKRMRTQLRFANLIDNWARFFTRILIHDLSGRRAAKRIESEHIKAYKEKNGRRPRGNLLA